MDEGPPTADAIPPPPAEEPGLSPEEIREAYRRDEALVRGLGRLQLGFGLFALGMAVWDASTILETRRFVAEPGVTTPAPWAFDPIRLAASASLLAYGLCAVCVGLGLRRLRRWAGRAIWACFGLSALLTVLFWVVAARSEWLYILSTAVLMPAFMLPSLALAWSAAEPKVRDVLTAEYAAIVGQTRPIEVKPRLPWSMRASLIFLVVLLLALGMLADLAAEGG